MGRDALGFAGSMREFIQTQTMHLEMFAAAFIERVGAEDAENFELVQEQDMSQPFTIKWYFRRKGSSWAETH